jgi:hypothetical protein
VANLRAESESKSKSMMDEWWCFPVKAVVWFILRSVQRWAENMGLVDHLSFLACARYAIGGMYCDVVQM